MSKGSRFLDFFQDFWIFSRIKGLNKTATFFDNFNLDSFREIVDRLNEIEKLQNSNDKNVNMNVNEQGQGSLNYTASLFVRWPDEFG